MQTERTYRKVMLVGLLFCAAFVVISFFARETAGKYLRSEKGG